MVESLIKATNASLDHFHLIGFSLGAHVSGHAGKKLKLKRISGKIVFSLKLDLRLIQKFHYFSLLVSYQCLDYIDFLT